jgi:hypothetical protein
MTQTQQKFLISIIFIALIAGLIVSLNVDDQDTSYLKASSCALMSLIFCCWRARCSSNSFCCCSLNDTAGKSNPQTQDPFNPNNNPNQASSETVNNDPRLPPGFPKRMALDNVSEKEAFRATDLMNNRPRKCLGYKTPFEVFKNDYYTLFMVLLFFEFCIKRLGEFNP